MGEKEIWAALLGGAILGFILGIAYETGRNRRAFDKCLLEESYQYCIENIVFSEPIDDVEETY